MPVHEPVHQGVHQLDGGAIAGGHLFMSGRAKINELSTNTTCPPDHAMAGGQARGHLKPAEISRFPALSTIFLLKFNKREIGKENALAKEYAREGGQVDNA